jgi:acyl-coenzyme A synthetase/AMP-(fatty) acid ligase
MVIFGGEPMPPKYLVDLMQTLPYTAFDNMYGPAEVNGCCHYTLPKPPDIDSVIPIGPICRIADALVVDASGREVDAGEAGELLVRTPTMMAGYWHRAAQTAAAIFQRDRGGLIESYYRTGDLVKEEGGNFVFLGRMDRQAKVRGYRVELDEIESTLVTHHAIEEAAVFTLIDDQASVEIHAVYLCTGPVDEANEGQILDYLQERLPWYAMPASLRALEQFPRTTTGKIDRRALSMEYSQ